ncbi:protein-methionine-sulfoxide reductase heme-binding subunit MsrQ [Photobacterium sp. ZSDE20]|uniref:Protein-methionine-sulfoxide reductase heme-binding subunit MsrQ n=1 Tax=Photobacterium pectinilyticum TaxID=2906793 RepID=A0ABT1NB09_9GAMM|nr:protein-methionine-sulfoxide reductase heme-binding subunit MsrQ [Photobacterium sp. ZSDE20]MCQ1060504.1 protein-methionine-sulfoxide reductase heme-binding subunit MsrQ [Photobacterium sp. ZSDE20]MDD1827900.1 protein-methionine-sulfoxide reductase heme-binding subunit MsrQ [Photobacterium sp. ZSDE20]
MPSQMTTQWRLKMTPRQVFWLKVLIHGVSLIFIAQLVYLTLTGGLGADPIQGISHFTGKAALNTLLLTLCVSPIAKLLKAGMLVRVRRLLGLYCFFWAVLHLTGYVVLDLNFNWSLVLDEIISRPYLTIGAVSWVILFALAVTSTQSIQRRMGKHWQKLHNWVYLATLLVPIHYIWSVKSGLIEPMIYLSISIGLLAFRYKALTKGLTARFNLVRVK